MKANGVEVKASKLIARLKKGGIKARVDDAGDLHPSLSYVEIKVDEDTCRCSLIGRYSYHEDCAEYGIDRGRSVASVMGVDFYRQILDAEYEDVEVDGLIEYDAGLTEEDVAKTAKDCIDFVEYDPDAFPFEEEKVTDEELVECLKWKIGDEVYAKDRKGNIYQYEDLADVPRGHKVLSEEEAVKEFARLRPGIRYYADWE